MQCVSYSPDTCLVTVGSEFDECGTVGSESECIECKNRRTDSRRRAGRACRRPHDAAPGAAVHLDTKIVHQYSCSATVTCTRVRGGTVLARALAAGTSHGPGTISLYLQLCCDTLLVILNTGGV